MAKTAPRNFTVEPPISYEAFPLAPIPAEAVKDLALGMRRLAAPPQPSAGAKRAVWIVHGMGQQVPFETLENITNGLMSAADRAGLPVDGPRFRNVRVDKQILQRVELVIHRKQAAALEVDLYECYWAPKTEGAVKLTDVVGFLWNGGTRGLLNYFQKFQRALFGGMTYFSLTWRTPAYLLITLAVLAALTVINAVIVGVSATIAGIGRSQTLVRWDRVPTFTCVAGIVCAVAITFGVTLLLAEMSRPARGSWKSEKRRNLVGNTICVLTWIALAITIFVIVAGAAIMAIAVWPKWVPGWLEGEELQRHAQGLANILIFASIALAVLARMQRRRGVSSGADRDQDWLLPALFYLGFGIHAFTLLGVFWLALHGGEPAAPPWLAGTAHWFLSLGLWRFLQTLMGSWLWSRLSKFGNVVLFSSYWVWPFLFLISACVRNLLVQYVGDVTAYVASNKIDRFDDLRHKLKDLAHGSANAVYAAKAPSGNQFEYGKVAVVGHSLGSVIAYDTLNRLLLEDDLAAGPPAVPRANIADRTSVFLTFGSPLDKTAYFFSILGQNTRHMREQLAAVVQPLIQGYKKYRTFPWVNVYSRNDIICGHLDFYDLPGTPVPPAVDNVKDEDAFVPLVAHVDYWGNSKVWDELLEAVVR